MICPSHLELMQAQKEGFSSAQKRPAASFDSSSDSHDQWITLDHLRAHHCMASPAIDRALNHTANCTKAATADQINSAAMIAAESMLCENILDTRVDGDSSILYSGLKSNTMSRSQSTMSRSEGTISESCIMDSEPPIPTSDVRASAIEKMRSAKQGEF
jgi:hypothetical protein